MFWNQNLQNSQPWPVDCHAISLQLFNCMQLYKANATKLLNMCPNRVVHYDRLQFIHSQSVCFWCMLVEKKENRGKTKVESRINACTLHTHSQSISQTNFHSICKEHMVNSQIKYSSLLNKSSILINLMCFLLSYSSFHSIHIVLVHYVENQKWMRIKTTTAQRIYPRQRLFNLWMCSAHVYSSFFSGRSRFSCIHLIHSSLLGAFVTIK